MRVAELFDLSGKTAIVTGGGSGLGRQFAEALAEAGANLLLCARRVERCQATATELSQRNRIRALAQPCDVRNPDEVREIVAITERDLGPVDILVNNAGTSWGAAPEDYPLEGWQKVIDVNLTGTFLFAQAAGRSMIDAGRSGSIINIASVAAFAGAPPQLMNAVAYNASKGGIIAFTRDLAVKWATHGIRVNAIAPGWFPSDMSLPLLEGREDEFLAPIPLNRLGTSDDLKGPVVFLASDASSYITGQTIIVDGGAVIS